MARQYTQLYQEVEHLLPDSSLATERLLSHQWGPSLRGMQILAGRLQYKTANPIHVILIGQEYRHVGGLNAAKSRAKHCPAKGSGECRNKTNRAPASIGRTSAGIVAGS
jgi:hypothetical protein